MTESPQPNTALPIIVLGAGVAGLAAAAQLLQAGHKVIVLEQRDHAGGAHRSRQIGPFTFDVGSIFYEESALIFDLAPSLRDLCPEVLSIQRRIAPDGSILLYPIEPRDLLRQNARGLVLSLLDLLFSRMRLQRDGSLDTLCRKRLGGRFFAVTGLQHYVTRFHHVSPQRIDEEFFFRRMAIIERFTRTRNLARSALRALLSRKSEAAGRQWPMRVRPRQGFNVLFARIVEHFSARGVVFSFGESVLSLERESTFFKVRTNRATHLASAVVSTIPLDTVHQALFSKPSGLESLNMSTIFVSAGWLHPDTGNVLFNFHAEGDWKRATIYSRIYPDPTITRAYFSVETTLSPEMPHDPALAFANFRAHAEQLGLVRDLRLEGHEWVESCYPLYAMGSRERIDAVMDKISRAGIITTGRQGRFEYLPTSTGVIAQVSSDLAGTIAAPEVSGRVA